MTIRVDWLFDSNVKTVPRQHGDPGPIPTSDSRSRCFFFSQLKWHCVTSGPPSRKLRFSMIANTVFERAQNNGKLSGRDKNYPL